MNFFKGCSLCCCDAIYRRVVTLFVAIARTMFRHIQFVSREDEDGVRYIGKHDFCSVLLHILLSNANLKKNSVSSTSPPFWKQSGVGLRSRLWGGATKGILFFPYPFPNYKCKIIVFSPTTFFTLLSPLSFSSSKMASWPIGSPPKCASSTSYEQWDVLVCLLLCTE